MSAKESKRDEQATVTDRNDIEVPAELAGVNLREAESCPACDGTEGLHERPAGYYHCLDCWSTWAGDFEAAEIVDYVRGGAA